MDHNKFESKKNIHSLGVGYICNFLGRAGFTILERNTKPDHHFQILAKTSGRTMLIAVRTDVYPNIGTIDETTKGLLINEAKQLNAIPHFTGLTVRPLETNDMEVEGSSEGTEYDVTFYGISIVREFGSLAVNK